MSDLAPEFSRIIDIRHLPPAAVEITPDADERRRLAGRFGLSAIESMVAKVDMIATGTTVAVTGRIRAAIIQACAISGEDFPVKIDEPVDLRFIHPVAPQPSAALGEDEIELSADDCDEIEYHGLTFDLGEALAQTLALAIDPFAEGPDADRARAEHNLAGEDEIELSADDCDEIEYHGLTFDLGEALAQTLALAIDPFAEGPDADRARAEHNLGGEATGGAFAALAALKPGEPHGD